MVRGMILATSTSWIERPSKGLLRGLKEAVHSQLTPVASLVIRIFLKEERAADSGRN
jgi:hypothetical protein